VLFVSALPAALALFLFFPRLDNPLWAIHISKPTGITGISDQMRMGSVGELSKSNEIAFRVRFEGPTPQPKQRYWRGLVLWHYDGITWTPNPSIRKPVQLQVNKASAIDYQLIQEPSHQPWVFALDMPAGISRPLLLNDDLRVVSVQPIKERSSFELKAYTDYRALGMSAQQRAMGLSLPENISRRTRELAYAWRQRHGDDDLAVVRAALAHFNQQPFVYTLSPGSLRGEPVDQFLFETRRGFCEHYAGSFAVLMRAAGIPTRIVLGYQGGEFNPRAEHWVVRQSDAHAWNEVWLAERGWVRIDPTAAVAPERIEHSIDSFQSSEEDRIVFRIHGDGLFANLWRETNWMLDAVEIGWHRWVLGFSHDRQNSLLQKLGFSDLKGYENALLVFLVMMGGMGFAYMISLLRKRPKSDLVRYQWDKLLAKMQRRGLDIPAWFGPQQVLAAATRRWPEQRDALQQIVRLYTHLRYGRVAGERQQQQLQRYIKRLKLG
jgi:transglutaminase-like putative cysteine protease